MISRQALEPEMPDKSATSPDIEPDVTPSPTSQARNALKNEWPHRWLTFLSDRSLELFFAASLAGVLLSEVLSLLFHPQWTIADWLINYSHGFVRRGLAGEIILLVAHLVHLPPTITTMIVQMIIYAAFMLKSSHEATHEKAELQPEIRER